MARRKKRKSILKPLLFNLMILFLLLLIIFFLIQRFILPLLQESKPTNEIFEEEKREEVLKEELQEYDLTLYFSDIDAEHLIPEKRRIKLNNLLETQAIIELIKGPFSENLFATVPPSTKVNTLYISDGIAYIDLSSDIIKDHPGGSTGELLTVYSIIMTLTSFPNIDKVQILIDGQSRDTLVGHIDISMPLEGDKQWLTP